MNPFGQLGVLRKIIRHVAVPMFCSVRFVAPAQHIHSDMATPGDTADEAAKQGLDVRELSLGSSIKPSKLVATEEVKWGRKWGRENYKCNLVSNFSNLSKLVGGDGGIRTLDTLLTYTPLAGERLQPLGHVSSPPTKCCMPVNGAGFKCCRLEILQLPDCFQSSLMIWPSRAALAPAKTLCAMASMASS